MLLVFHWVLVQIQCRVPSNGDEKFNKFMKTTNSRHHQSLNRVTVLVVTAHRARAAVAGLCGFLPPNMHETVKVKKRLKA